MPVKLYTFSVSATSATVRTFLAVTGIDFEEEDVLGKTRTPEYISKFPTNKTPAIEHGDTLLAESATVLRYLCLQFPDKAGKYYPKEKSAHIDMLLDYINTGICSIISKASYPKLGFPAYPGDVASLETASEETKQESIKLASEDMSQALKDKYEDIFLAKTKFLMSDEPTIADFRFAPMLDFIKVGCKISPRLQKYYDDMCEFPGFKDACQSVVDCASSKWV